MLEAMAMSKPIVSTDIEGSGVPWINQDGITGLTVPVGQPGPLAHALKRLLDDRELARSYGAAARQRYEQDFRVDEMARNVVALYRRVLAS
jgi:rhamnosyl/mannosyltransferase